MKITKTKLEKIRNFSKEQIQQNDSWHQWFHVEQTIKLAKILAEKENADATKCEISALLHDICKYQEEKGKNHGAQGAKLAEFYLNSLHLDKRDIGDICYAILNHNRGGKKNTKEAEIIYDADKLQGVGPYGLLRNYGCCVAQGDDQEKAYARCLQEQEFFIKGLYTKTARKIARRSVKTMKKFHSDYKRILEARI